MELTVRQAEEADFAQIIALINQLAEFENQPEKMTNTVERMREEREYFHCFVAETADRRIVGYATWFFCYYTWSGKSLYMDDLYVVPSFRQQGVGSMLINRIIAHAKENRCRKLRWQVSQWNTPALDLYRKLGALIDNTEQNCDLLL